MMGVASSELYASVTFKKRSALLATSVTWLKPKVITPMSASVGVTRPSRCAPRRSVGFRGSGRQGGGKITGRMRCCKAIRRSNIRYFLKSVWLYGRRVYDTAFHRINSIGVFVWSYRSLPR
jgi:hypothetical protein